MARTGALADVPETPEWESALAWQEKRAAAAGRGRALLDAVARRTLAVDVNGVAVQVRRPSQGELMRVQRSLKGVADRADEASAEAASEYVCRRVASWCVDPEVAEAVMVGRDDSLGSYTTSDRDAALELALEIFTRIPLAIREGMEELRSFRRK